MLALCLAHSICLTPAENVAHANNMTLATYVVRPPASTPASSLAHAGGMTLSNYLVRTPDLTPIYLMARAGYLKPAECMAHADVLIQA